MTGAVHPAGRPGSGDRTEARMPGPATRVVLRYAAVTGFWLVVLLPILSGTR
ncbi:hypothetical protein GCM10023196_013720 [Actinoallomurus vinaceus]|uniref:Uncharacterized protein n=1 Tax=Actinoallomurus vinaceus TaxID=1080074 RepID=A0ABP8U5L0_9ACTN